MADLGKQELPAGLAFLIQRSEMQKVDAHWITVNTGEVQEGPVDVDVLYTTGLMLRCAAKHFEVVEGLKPEPAASLALARYQKMVFESLRVACTGPERVN